MNQRIDPSHQNKSFSTEKKIILISAFCMKKPTIYVCVYICT